MPSMDVALKEDVNGKVYRGHYDLDGQGNVRGLKFSKDVRFIADDV